MFPTGLSIQGSFWISCEVPRITYSTIQPPLGVLHAPRSTAQDRYLVSRPETARSFEARAVRSFTCDSQKSESSRLGVRAHQNISRCRSWHRPKYVVIPAELQTRPIARHPKLQARPNRGLLSLATRFSHEQLLGAGGSYLQAQFPLPARVV
jgi:hypothetical protein